MFFFAIWMNWKHRNNVMFQNRPMAGSEGIIRNEVGGWTSFSCRAVAHKGWVYNVQKFSINN